MEASKAKLAKEPKDEKAAKKRKYDSAYLARRKEKLKSVDMDKERLAEDEARLEAQLPGVMNDVGLWKASDGNAMRGQLHYSSAELRIALKALDKPGRVRVLPQLVLDVKEAYGWAS